MEAEALEPVEDIDDEPTVDPTHDRPTEIDEVLEFEVLAGVEAQLVVGFQGVEIVGAEVHLKLRGLGACGVKSGLHRSLIVLQVALTFLINLRFEVGIVDLLLADEHSREELVLEGYPVEGFFDVLLLVGGLAEVVC